MLIVNLPPFVLLHHQPDPPHVARTVAKNEIANEHGALITFTVRQSRNGKSWWISATREGFRMSSTLHTTQPAKAQTWIAAVKAGQVSIGEERTLKCEMDDTCPAPVTHIDEKGFVYCTCHGVQRRDWKRCRKLRPYEINKLISGQPIKSY